jgi:hypothetical protein
LSILPSLVPFTEVLPQQIMLKSEQLVNRGLCTSCCD